MHLGLLTLPSRQEACYINCLVPIVLHGLYWLDKFLFHFFILVMLYGVWYTDVTLFSHEQ